MKGFTAVLAVVVLVLAGCGGQSAPAIPHQVGQNMDCRQCHQTGKNGAKITNHIDRPNCTGCHQVKQ